MHGDKERKIRTRDLPSSKGADTEQGDTFKDLGYFLSFNGKCLHDVKTIIAKDTFCQMKDFTKMKNISVQTMIKIESVLYSPVWLRKLNSGPINNSEKN